MASQGSQGSHANGATGAVNGFPKSKRFSDVPATIDVQMADQDDEAVELDLQALDDDPTELCAMFETERVPRTCWMTVALAYAKQDKIDFAIEVLVRGAQAVQQNNPREKLSLVALLCAMYLRKAREAPRTPPEGALVSEAKTKDYYLQQATATINEASRINPGFPPLHIARGAHTILRASLQAPSKANGAAPGAVDADKADISRSALKYFDEALRASHGRNMMAVMGKARTLYSLGKYPEALAAFQEVVARMPDFVDPDPRLGIGCCLWQLGHKEDAKEAWERCLEINPDEKVANIYLGLYYLDATRNVPTNSPEFIQLYKKAMTEYTQKAFKLDKNMPLVCATFANYFLSRKQFSTVDVLAHKAIHYTDVNAIASDGWYLLAKKEHYEGNLDRAADHYRRADEARGGAERGYLPAKFGAAQLSVLRNDLGEAKLRLEKMIQQSKNYEAMILLGTLYAMEVFANQYATVKEDKSAETKKAISLLESVRAVWKDPKKNLVPDPAVLLNLARLYETENPERALQCLQQVEQLELDQIPEEDRPKDITDENAMRTALRKFLPPQLLNNIGCFYSQADKHAQASEMFQAALSACMRIGEQGDDTDTDALVTTISFNLGRSYEAQSLTAEAVEVYEGLLKRHDDYTDARLRLAYIKLRTNPTGKEGPDAVAKLYQEHPSDLEVRTLYGWYLGKVHARKRPANPNEDPELRHHKHTLQNYDKHDRYALVAMGNLWLQAAREMRRETEAERQKRSSTFARAVEFYDKALQLDPKNAYAAQGLAIALVEDKKDAKNALPIFSMVRDTLKDPGVYVNLGHIYALSNQYSKAIENYEIALSKEGKANDASILTCLGKVWIDKGRKEHNLDALKTALECAQKALAVAPDTIHFKFNVALTQITIATEIHKMSETQRNSLQLQDAAEGLEAAIIGIEEVAASPNPPYPKHDLEQRANMARNTQRKQLERALASQKEYEEKNKEKFAAAMEQRQAELRRKEEERRKAEEAEHARQEKIRREREEIQARDRLLAEQRAEEERQRLEAELTTDSETGEKVKRQKRKAPPRSDKEPKPRKGRARRKKSVTTDGDDSGEEQSRPKKKQKLIQRRREAAKNSKFKSAEIVEDSSDDGEEDELEKAERNLERRASSPLSEIEDNDGDKMDVEDNAGGAGGDDDDEDEDATVSRRQNARSRRARGVVDESDEEEDGDADEGAKDEDAENGDGDEQKGDTSMADADEDED